MNDSRVELPIGVTGKRRLKVAFVGTHGVGKTTLCFDLASQLKRLDLGVDLVKEVARRCPLPKPAVAQVGIQRGQKVRCLTNRVPVSNLRLTPPAV